MIRVYTQRRKSQYKKSIRENHWSEVDLVGCGHVILKLYHVVENQSPSLADRVVADNPLLC